MKSEGPLVSVVIPCYNHEQFVQDSIQSVIDQTYKNIELIIIDDGSKDGSVEKIQEMVDLCEKRFTRFEFRSRPNKGLSSTLNEALEWCEGKYFSALASDDIMLKLKTNTQVDFLEKKSVFAAVFGSVTIIDNNNEILSDWIVKNKEWNFNEIIMHRHELLAPTAMIRMEVIKSIGGYNTNFYIEDWFMWLKISKQKSLYSTSEKFSLYRSHDENSSKHLGKMHKARLEILKEYEDERLYKRALKNILWLNFREDTSNKKYSKLVQTKILMKSYPRQTIVLIGKKLISSVFKVKFSI